MGAAFKFNCQSKINYVTPGSDCLTLNYKKNSLACVSISGSISLFLYKPTLIQADNFLQIKGSSLKGNLMF